MKRCTQFRLTIATENAAFDEDPCSEIVRILRAAANTLENGVELPRNLRDYNGNRVGAMEVDEED